MITDNLFLLIVILSSLVSTHKWGLLMCISFSSPFSTSRMNFGNLLCWAMLVWLNIFDPSSINFCADWRGPWRSLPLRRNIERDFWLMRGLIREPANSIFLTMTRSERIGVYLRLVWVGWSAPNCYAIGQGGYLVVSEILNLWNSRAPFLAMIQPSMRLI